MNRSFEATLSRQNMSNYKTIYLEGDLDMHLIESYLSNLDIQNIRILRIVDDKEKISFGTCIPDYKLGAKHLLIELIKHSNLDSTIETGKYLGIVDKDFDFCFATLEEVENLLYTDNNSMESYLIDSDLFKSFAKEYKIDDLSVFETNFETYISNMKDFNVMFMVQLKYYLEFSENLISFSEVPLCTKPFVRIDDNYEICTESIVN